MKKLLIVASFLVAGVMGIAQPYNMCSSTSTSDTTGTLFDSGGPSGNYSDAENCGFLINPGCATSIVLTFLSIDIESCCDAVILYDGPNNASPLLINATGTTVPGPVTATSGQVYIEFTSDFSVTGQGFEIQWQSVVGSQSPITAAFTPSTVTPAYQEVVNFTDNSTPGPSQWRWDFGDGATSTLQNPSHAYNSPGNKTITLIAGNCTYTDTIMQTITVQNPPLLFSKDTLVVNLACGDSISETITFYNDSIVPLGYQIPTGGLPLDTVLARVNRWHPDITSLVPSLFLFSDGDTGDNIIDGGNDMYDGGNFLNTDISGTSNIPYSDNLIIPSTDFGASGQYFTRKVPGLFVLGADIDGVNHFNITGNLGADGSGNSDGAVLTTNMYGKTFTGFVNRTFNAFDPSINRLIIVEDNPSAAHTFLSTTQDEDHEVTGLASSSRIYYLLFAAQGGLYVTDTEVHAIMDEFLGMLEAVPEYLTISPASDTIPGGDSTVVTFSFNPSGLNSGTYNSTITVNNTTPPYATYFVNTIVNISGPAMISMSDSCVNFGPSIVNETLTDTFDIFNSGCDTLYISNITSSNGDYTLGSGTMDTIFPGATSQAIVNFTPTILGNNNGFLTIFNNAGDTTICLTGFGRNIVANFNASGQDSCSGEIAFRDTTRGTPTSWTWSFGDGQTSNLQHPTHYYAGTGTYNVQLIACNATGCDTIVQQVTINFTINYNVVTTGTQEINTALNFTVNGTGILTTQWDFGDGSNTAFGATASHSYPIAGTYIVTASILTVDGCAFDVRDTLNITEPDGIAKDLSDMVNIYPNPAKDNVIIASSIDLNNAQLQIINMLGETVLSKRMEMDSKEVRLNVNDLENGSYFLKISTTNGDYIHQKVIIEK